MPLTLDGLPAESVWTLPVADTRAPLSTVLLRSNGEGLAIDAALAADFPVLSLQTGGWELQAGLLAGAFMQFGAGGELTFDLQTFDGQFGLPVDARSGPWSARVQWVHVSAHYGDGIRKSGAAPENLNAYSREYVSLLGSRDLVIPRVVSARAYLGAHALIHSLPEAPPLAVQVGGEVFGPWQIAPYLAVDLHLAQEHTWAPAMSGQLGLAASAGPRRFRLGLAARTGPDDTGKTAGTPERWIGVLFGFDHTGRVRTVDDPG